MTSGTPLSRTTTAPWTLTPFDGRLVIGQQVGGVVQVVAEHRMVFPAQAVVDRQPRRDLPVVLRIHRVARGIPVGIRLDAPGQRVRIRDSQQEGSVRIADHRRAGIIKRVDA
jgi:hypothetical protein